MEQFRMDFTLTERALTVRKKKAKHGTAFGL